MKVLSCVLLIFGITCIVMGCGKSLNDPSIKAFTIDDDLTYTNTAEVSLCILLSENKYAKMCFSNDNIIFSGWEDYYGLKHWQIESGDGEKIVYTKFKDSNGNISATYTSSIILDTIPPNDVKAISLEATNSKRDYNVNIVNIRWESPSDNDFTEICLIVNNNKYPETVGDISGECGSYYLKGFPGRIQEGSFLYQSYLSSSVKVGDLRYYAVFSLDKAGNVSNGVKGVVQVTQEL